MTTDHTRGVAGEILGRAELPTKNAVLRQAVIAAVTTPTLSIQFVGSAVVIPGVAMLDSYAPVVGHTVQLLQAGTDLLVLGKVKT